MSNEWVTECESPSPSAHWRYFEAGSSESFGTELRWDTVR